MKLEQLNEMSAVSSNDLKQLYLKFNRRYFDNELPNDLKVGWNRSVKLMGQVKARFRKPSLDVISVDSLSISNQFEWDEDTLKGIMMHEMIHVHLLYVQNIVYTSGSDKMHGREFKEKLKELEHIVPFVIPLTEVPQNKLIPIRDKNPKRTGVILRIRPNGKKSVSGMTYKTLVENIDKIKTDLTVASSFSGEYFRVFDTSSPYVKKLSKIARSWNLLKARFTILPDDEIEEIINEANHVFFEVGNEN